MDIDGRSGDGLFGMHGVDIVGLTVSTGHDVKFFRISRSLIQCPLDARALPRLEQFDLFVVDFRRIFRVHGADVCCVRPFDAALAVLEPKRNGKRIEKRPCGAKITGQAAVLVQNSRQISFGPGDIAQPQYARVCRSSVHRPQHWRRCVA